MNSNTFQLGNQIGEGGLAVVFEAKDLAGINWALKRFKTSIVDEKQKGRFRQEIRIQSMLRHPNIVPVVAANSNANPPFYVMPRADTNLEHHISVYSANNQAFQPIARQLIDALGYAHSQRVLHRDIKPRNVLMTQGVASLADFGLGKALDIEASYMTTTSDSWGTYWYAPPEQRKGLSHCDERSDIYSLGKLFLHCLSGTQANEIPEHLDSGWHYVIRKATRDDPAKRWQSIEAMRRQFDLVFRISEPLVVDPDGLIEFIADIATQRDTLTSDQLHTFLSFVSALGDDEILLRRVFDKLPPNLVESWSGSDPVGFSQFIHRYDASLGNILGFDYCDTLANQYAMIHSIAQDSDLREFLRKRLLSLGPLHNRWHVGQVFGEILATIRDPADIAQCIESLTSNPGWADWNREYIQDARIDKRIRDVVNENTSQGTTQ